MVTGMTEMKLPKYIRAQKGSLYFQRDYPTRLRHLVAKKTYTAPLSLKVSNVTDVSMSQAVDGATKAYDIHLRMIENSDPAAFNKDEKNSAADEWLRKKNLRVGQFEFYNKDPAIAEREQREQRQLQPDALDMAEMSAPEFDDVFYKRANGETLDVHDEVILIAQSMLTKASKAKPQELKTLWKHYVKHRGLDLDSRAGKRSNGHWGKWLAITGNHLIAADTLNRIHYGLDVYVDKRVAEGVKGASIQRGMNEIVACLRYCSKKFRFGWLIEPPAITMQKKKSKAVMDLEQQRVLISKCLMATGSDAPVAACIILMLQGAMMTSEVCRLDSQSGDIALDGTLPFVLIRNETKTNDRQRLVPLVFGVEYLKEHLDETIAWLRRTTDSTHSARVKKLMRKFTGDLSLTGHGCRHTFRSNCEAAGVPSTVTAAIGGWSGASLGLSDNMLDYGTEGLTKAAVVQQLYRFSKDIHKHLL